MLWNQKKHWQTVNTGARLVGSGFVFVGFIFSVWGLSLLLDSKATINVDGVPTADPWTKAILLIVGFVIFVLGLLLAFARPIKAEVKHDD